MKGELTPHSHLLLGPFGLAISEPCGLRRISVPRWRGSHLRHLCSLLCDHGFPEHAPNSAGWDRHSRDAHDLSSPPSASTWTTRPPPQSPREVAQLWFHTFLGGICTAHLLGKGAGMERIWEILEFIQRDLKDSSNNLNFQRSIRAGGKYVDG